jgi:hypothetical protein
MIGSFRQNHSICSSQQAQWGFAFFLTANQGDTEFPPTGRSFLHIHGPIDIEIIIKGIFPDRFENLHQVPDIVWPLNNPFPQQHYGHHVDSLLSKNGFYLDSISSFESSD